MSTPALSRWKRPTASALAWLCLVSLAAAASACVEPGASTMAVPPATPVTLLGAKHEAPDDAEIASRQAIGRPRTREAELAILDERERLRPVQAPPAVLDAVVSLDGETEDGLHPGRLCCSLSELARLPRTADSVPPCRPAMRDCAHRVYRFEPERRFP